MNQANAEKAALCYLMFGDLLPDGGERLVRIMDEADEEEDDE